MRAVEDQFDRYVRVDPFGVMQRRCRDACDYSFAFRPQPSSDGPVLQRQSMTFRRVDIRIEGPIPPRKFMPCHETSRDGLSANEDLPHGQILQTGSDTSAKDQRLGIGRTSTDCWMAPTAPVSSKSVPIVVPIPSGP